MKKILIANLLFIGIQSFVMSSSTLPSQKHKENQELFDLSALRCRAVARLKALDQVPCRLYVHAVNLGNADVIKYIEDYVLGLVKKEDCQKRCDELDVSLNLSRENCLNYIFQVNADFEIRSTIFEEAVRRKRSDVQEFMVKVEEMEKEKSLGLLAHSSKK